MKTLWLGSFGGNQNNNDYTARNAIQNYASKNLTFFNQYYPVREGTWCKFSDYADNDKAFVFSRSSGDLNEYLFVPRGKMKDKKMSAVALNKEIRSKLDTHRIESIDLLRAIFKDEDAVTRFMDYATYSGNLRLFRFLKLNFSFYKDLEEFLASAECEKIKTEVNAFDLFARQKLGLIPEEKKEKQPEDAYMRIDGGVPVASINVSYYDGPSDSFCMKSDGKIEKIPKEWRKWIIAAQRNIYQSISFAGKEETFITGWLIKPEKGEVAICSDVMEMFKPIWPQKMVEKEYNIIHDEKEINSCFEAAGIPGMKVAYMIPSLVNVTYSRYDYAEQRNNYETVNSCVGYVCGFSYKDDMILGTNSKNAGFTFVRKHDGVWKMSLSAWCQRISSWSKNDLGVVDQHYDIWKLEDWIVGPYQEMCGVSFSEAPIIFSGAKAKDRKAAILRKIKAM
jgi:hypothetical protein